MRDKGVGRLRKFTAFCIENGISLACSLSLSHPSSKSQTPKAKRNLRTGRSSDRLGGRCSVCSSVPSAVSAHSSSAVRYREAWRRGETRRRWRRRRRQRHARADGFGLGGAATAWAAAALSARACRLPSLCAARERSGAGKRGGAGKRAAEAAAAARAGGLIRTGRSDRLGGRRRSRRKLSIYVQ